MNRKRQAWLFVGLSLVLGALVYAQVGARERQLAQGVLIDAGEQLGLRGERKKLRPSFAKTDVLPHLSIDLEHVASGFTRPTDLAFTGGKNPAMLVLEQNGLLSVADLRTGKRARWFTVEVEDEGNEQGLLGVALHPNFADNGRFFLNYTRARGEEVLSFVSEYRCGHPAQPFADPPKHVHSLLQLVQPFSNHNGGSLVFGPDGMLYIGFGDGGSGGDPYNHGQNRKSWLGSILRIDIDGQAPPLRYRIPADNPFVSQADYAPEAFAIGVRNPWRISFDPKGRLIVADVGQNEWEEVGYALSGDNLGWAIMEGKTCFRKKECDSRGLRLPFLVYDREQGISVTGGYVVTSKDAGALQGLYLYGDYGSGRIWAAELPEPAKDSSRVFTTGAWPINPSTFGRDPAGNVYVADHQRGDIYRIVAKQ
jgi:glucose/arabinose dehydrogenase